MTAPTETTAVAKRDEKRENWIGTLPTEIQMQLYQSRQLAEATAEMNKLNWGDKLDHGIKVAIAKWAAQWGLDATEIDVLGGKPYVNARYYIRRLGELQLAGEVGYAYCDNVVDDARLASPDYAAEKKRRGDERILYGIHDRCTGAAIAHVKLRNQSRELTAANWVDPQDTQDPVGKASPILTAETRAWRRVMRLVVSHASVLDRRMEQEVELLSQRATDARVIASHPFRGAEPQLEPVKSLPPSEPAPVESAVPPSENGVAARTLGWARAFTFQGGALGKLSQKKLFALEESMLDQSEKGFDIDEDLCEAVHLLLHSNDQRAAKAGAMQPGAVQDALLPNEKEAA